MMKYPKIKVLGDKENKDMFIDDTDIITVQEKIDGANFRFQLTDNGLIFGSRTQELVGCTEENKQWGRCIAYLQQILGKQHRSEMYKYIFYGECCTPHSTPYDWQLIPPFLGFDIYDTEQKQFLPWSIVSELYNELGLITVPTIVEMSVQELSARGYLMQVDDAIVPISKYYNGQAEGIVFKNYEKQIFAKYVTAKHKEAATKIFGGSKKWATDDTGKMVAQYCTNGRIDKMIYKLRDEGLELAMSMMKVLPSRVFEDIVEEHYRDILSKNHIIDVSKFRKSIAKRCLTSLKNIITLEALNAGRV